MTKRVQQALEGNGDNDEDRSYRSQRPGGHVFQRSRSGIGITSHDDIQLARLVFYKFAAVFVLSTFRSARLKTAL